MKRFQIIVEGDADKKFFEDSYHHIFGERKVHCNTCERTMVL